MFKRFLVGVPVAIAGLTVAMAPMALAKEGQIFDTLQQCQAQAAADVAAAGGSWNLYAWCENITHIPEGPGCPPPAPDGCLVDDWVEHTRPV